MINDRLKSIRGKLESPESPVLKMTPEQIDAALNDLYDLGLHTSMLQRLATHYGVSFPELKDLLVARIGLLIHLMADYEKRGTPAQLQTILREQTAQVADVISRLHQCVDEVTAMLEATRALHDRAHNVVSKYQDEASQIDRS